MPYIGQIRQVLVVCACVAGMVCCSQPEETLPDFFRWGKVELVFQGPAMHGMGDPNPFNITFDVMFTAPDGTNHLVPGFYDGDGEGGLDGNVWKARYSAGQNGVWRWHTQSTEPSLNGLSGQIQVVDPPLDAPNLYRLGRLEYVGERYLKFREGGYWIKAGADEPENLLGAAFGQGDWEAKKRQIDYLASTGVNSVYIMMMNIDGDHRDVWPWVGDTGEEAKQNSARYDVAKLEHWRDLFEHIQSSGLVIQIVLEDDSAWTGHDYTRYYREMVARFGYLPAIYYNFCEEYNEAHTLDAAIDFMRLLRTIDPYGRPRAIHNVNLPRNEFLDSEAVQVTSIQTDPKKPASLNQLAVDWTEAALARNRPPPVVSFDEARPAGDRRSWWAVYMGGGIWESLLPVENDYREFDQEWGELGVAKRFMEPLPVDGMIPLNQAVVGGVAFCLARPGEIYALYLPAGGEAELNLVEDNRYQVRWFDPRLQSAIRWVDGPEVGGGRQTLAPPGAGDWAALIERVAGNADGPPVAFSAKVNAVRNEPVRVHLAAWQPDDSAELRYEVLTQPRFGRLDGEPPDVIYTARPGFTGKDRFEWRAVGEAGASTVASVTITCNASGDNQPPRAYGQTVQAPAGEPTTFTLRYRDVDGPGPYRIRIRKPPENGRIEGLDNDITYTPDDGFTGTDAIEWSVSDGAGRSNLARVRILVR